MVDLVQNFTNPCPPLCAVMFSINGPVMQEAITSWWLYSRTNTLIFAASAHHINHTALFGCRLPHVELPPYWYLWKHWQSHTLSAGSDIRTGILIRLVNFRWIPGWLMLLNWRNYKHGHPKLIWRHSIPATTDATLSTSWFTRFAPTMGQIGPKWNKPGHFQIRFQYILALRQNVLKSDMKKSQVCLIWCEIWPIIGSILVTQV